jgi:hypothetical protein
MRSTRTKPLLHNVVHHHVDSYATSVSTAIQQSNVSLMYACKMYTAATIQGLVVSPLQAGVSKQLHITARDKWGNALNVGGEEFFVKIYSLIGKTYMLCSL